MKTIRIGSRSISSFKPGLAGDPRAAEVFGGLPFFAPTHAALEEPQACGAGDRGARPPNCFYSFADMMSLIAPGRKERASLRLNFCCEWRSPPLLSLIYVAGLIESRDGHYRVAGALTLGGSTPEGSSFEMNFLSVSWVGGLGVSSFHAVAMSVATSSCEKLGSHWRVLIANFSAICFHGALPRTLPLFTPSYFAFNCDLCASSASGCTVVADSAFAHN